MAKAALANKAKPTRSPAREALAAAIADRAAIVAALAENERQQQRTLSAQMAATDAIEAAEKAVEEAKLADATAVAQGRPPGAVRAARQALQDAHDAHEAANAADALLKEEHQQLSAPSHKWKLEAAVGAAIKTDPATLDLVKRFRAAQRELHEIRQAMEAISSAGGVPQDAQFWDAGNWDERLPPSETAAKVKGWIAALRSDADAQLQT